MNATVIYIMLSSSGGDTCLKQDLQQDLSIIVLLDNTEMSATVKYRDMTLV